MANIRWTPSSNRWHRTTLIGRSTISCYVTGQRTAGCWLRGMAVIGQHTLSCYVIGRRFVGLSDWRMTLSHSLCS